MFKKCKTKIVATLLLILTLVSNIIPIIPAVKSLAANNIGTTLDIICVGDVPYHLKSYGVPSKGYVKTSLTGYYDNGVFYPAFCLEREKPGVDSDREYSVTLTEILADRDTYNKIWRVVTAGYPYKSIESLGVSDWAYAFQATKMAVYCVLGQCDINDFYATDSEGQAIVDLIHRLVNEGENGTSTYRTPISSINKSGNMILSGNYYIQNYNLTANIEITNYNIASTGFPNGTLITDTAGTQRNTFNPGETFQVRIPKNSVETGDINGRVRATVTSKSYAVFYGTSPDESLQDYAVAGDPIALTSSSANIEMKGNTAGIKIKKIDVDTNQPIPNTVFQISKQDGTVIGTATTNAAGIATFNNLYQSNYVIKEIKSNDNYVIMQETINIPAYYNKITEQTLTNEHKKGRIQINKTDSETSEPVKDVTFQLLDLNDNVVQTGTTDKNGVLIFDNIRIGNYKLKEISTNSNYVLNTTIFDVKVEYEKTTVKNITNDYKKGNLKIDKIDAETKNGIEGVTFELQKKDGTVVGRATTNKNGEAYFNNIRIGDYILKEVETNINYILNTMNFEVTIEYDKTIVKEITNEHKRGNISVLKVDKDNNKITLRKCRIRFV
ncbi:MAG: Cys-Gln thioester bond-forming surface protein [Clostridia bacterium]|nr:Cys-Gln thioester bond-forming surface protein [Clostridia bacterium]